MFGFSDHAKFQDHLILASLNYSQLPRALFFNHRLQNNNDKMIKLCQFREHQLRTALIFFPISFYNRTFLFYIQLEICNTTDLDIVNYTRSFFVRCLSRGHHIHFLRNKMQANLQIYTIKHDKLAKNMQILHYICFSYVLEDIKARQMIFLINGRITQTKVISQAMEVGFRYSNDSNIV